MAFEKGMFVVYRDPDLFWAADKNHTDVYKVSHVNSDGTLDLDYLHTDSQFLPDIDPRYVVPLSVEDVMRDIDDALPEAARRVREAGEAA